MMQQMTNLRDRIFTEERVAALKKDYHDYVVPAVKAAVVGAVVNMAVAKGIDVAKSAIENAKAAKEEKTASAGD